MFVTFVPGLFETSVIFFCQFNAPICEVVSLHAHQFVRLAAQCLTDMTCSTIVFLKQFVSGQLYIVNGSLFTFQIKVETGIRSKQCLFKLLDRIRDILFGITIGIYSQKGFGKVCILLQFRNDFID